MIIAVALQFAEGNWDKAKAAVDYALHFPDYVRYPEHGHSQIIDEIKITLETLRSQNQKEFDRLVSKMRIPGDLTSRD